MTHGEPPRSVVFGGTSGIGMATADLLSAREHNVTIVGRSPETVRQATLTLDNAVAGVSLDAVDDDAVRQFFETAPPFDHIVISLAGGAAIGPFHTLAEAAFRSALEVKLFGYINIARHARAKMTPNGSITMVTGVAGRKAVPYAASLAMANAAIEALVRTLALEYAPIRVNAVAPGTTATPAWDRMPPTVREEMFQSSANRTPLKRIAQPSDVAMTINALIENPFITGVVSVCDGGSSLV